MPPSPPRPAYPLSQFVLKVHGRCDLACDHCYVYHGADQSFRAKPNVMSLDILRATAERIGAHAADWALPAVRVVLHGGEPLLLGPARMRSVLTVLTETIGSAAPDARLLLSMQTNGLRLDRAMCDVLKDFAVTVGVSLDGDRAANDRHRRHASGASSFDHVRAALALLREPKYRTLYGGILCTVDVRNDPDQVYAALVAEQPPKVDFLLPHANWAEPPFRPAGNSTPYATWLTRIYQRWLADAEPMRVRMFDSLRSTAEGGPSGSEQFGTDAVDLLVVDTDGQWEQADSIKTAFDGAPWTGMHVLTHSVDEVSRFAAIALRQQGVAGLSAICGSCPVVKQCGGGLYAHRYRPGSGFDNPSVYCADLRELVTEVNNLTSARHGAEKVDDSSLPVQLVDQIASGFGDENTLRWLASAELNITRALLASVVDQFGHADAWDALTQVEAHSPQAASEVLSHPYVRIWAVNQLRSSVADHAAYLGTLAAAAALRAGLAIEVEAGVRGGVVHLPSVGTAYWPGAGTGAVRLSVQPGRLSLADAGRALAVDIAAQPAPAAPGVAQRAIGFASGLGRPVLWPSAPPRRLPCRHARHRTRRPCSRRPGRPGTGARAPWVEGPDRCR